MGSDKRVWPDLCAAQALRVVMLAIRHKPYLFTIVTVVVSLTIGVCSGFARHSHIGSSGSSGNSGW